MAKRLRVGVIGLGRRWRRYRRALAALRGRVEVRAVCDQVAWRAEMVARQARCDMAAGPEDLLGREDVDAVLLLDEQWFGLWPLERACRAGKPVFCAVPLDGDEDHADRLREQIESSRLPVLMALPALLAPSVVRLGELLKDRLGPARLVRAERAVATVREGRSLLDGGAALSLLAACTALMGEEPASVQTMASGPGLATFLLDFGNERAAQVTLWTGPAVRPGCWITAAAERGTATADLPRRLRWDDAEGRHRLELPGGSMEQVLLGQFVQALSEGSRLEPGFPEAHRALTWLRASLRESVVRNS
jgi:predicted dehydrogenase